jgi:hypothetical protein
MALIANQKSDGSWPDIAPILKDVKDFKSEKRFPKFCLFTAIAGII